MNYNLRYIDNIITRNINRYLNQEIKELNTLSIENKILKLNNLINSYTDVYQNLSFTTLDIKKLIIKEFNFSYKKVLQQFKDENLKINILCKYLKLSNNYLVLNKFKNRIITDIDKYLNLKYEIIENIINRKIRILKRKNLLNRLKEYINCIPIKKFYEQVLKKDIEDNLIENGLDVKIHFIVRNLDNNPLNFNCDNREIIFKIDNYKLKYDDKDLDIKCNRELNFYWLNSKFNLKANKEYILEIIEHEKIFYNESFKTIKKITFKDLIDIYDNDKKKFTLKNKFYDVIFQRIK